MKDFSLFAVMYKRIAAIALMIIIAGISLRCSNESGRNALFSEPSQICKRENPTFYHTISYNTAEYEKSNKSDNKESNFSTKSDPGEIPEVDGNSRDKVNEAMHKNVAAAPESLALARLRYKSVYKDRQPYKQLQIVYPEDKSLFPPNLCAPFVTWEDPNNTLWQVVIEIPGEKSPYSFITPSKEWRFPKDLWEKIKKETFDQDALLRIRGIRLDEKGKKSGVTQCTEPVHFRISKDAADDFIVYRQVAPPFSSYKTPDIYVRDIRQDTPEMFLSARREYCMNCHHFSNKTETPAN